MAAQVCRVRRSSPTHYFLRPVALIAAALFLTVLSPSSPRLKYTVVGEDSKYDAEAKTKGEIFRSSSEATVVSSPRTAQRLLYRSLSSTKNPHPRWSGAQLRGGKGKINPNRGAYDEGLSKMLEAHGYNSALMLDTVLDFLDRKSTYKGKKGLQAVIRGLLRKEQEQAEQQQQRTSSTRTTPPPIYHPPPSQDQHHSQRQQRQQQDEDEEDEEQQQRQQQQKQKQQDDAQRQHQAYVAQQEALRQQAAFDANAPEMPLRLRISQVAREAYQEALDTGMTPDFNKPRPAAKNADTANGEPAQGTKCKHAGCEKKYEGPHSEGQKCRYHPGGPVFHEGEKYWSCCKRRTINFHEFLSTPGCAIGRCTFKDKSSALTQVEVPRWDMMESGGDAVFAIYARKIDPDNIELSATSTKLRLKMTWEMGKPLDIVIELKGPIIPQMSHAELRDKKIEITMKKADGVHWRHVGKVLDANSGLEIKQRSEFALPNAF